MLTLEQVAARTGYLGGSDAAAVLGLSRWKTPLQVWAEKTGNVVPEDRSDALPIEVGDALEDLVAQLYCKRTGAKAHRVNDVVEHPTIPFLKAQIDRRIVGTDEILECKTASGWKAGEWEGDDIPQEYLLQCHHQMLVTGKSACHIAVLIGGNQDFIYKTIKRDEALLADMQKREVAFWTDCVLPRVMPGSISPNDGETLYNLYPIADVDSAVPLPATAEAMIARIKEIGTDTTGLLAALEAEKEQLRNELKAILGPAALGTIGGWKVSWKNQSTGVRLDTARIKLEAPEVYEKYGTEKQTRVMRIDAIKPPKASKKKGDN